MKLVSATKIGCSTKSQKKQRAQIRIVILALVSFLLGVAATAVWFHLVSKGTVGSSSSQVTRPASPPIDQEAAALASRTNSPAGAFVRHPVPVPPAAIEEVKRALPNYASLSIDQGTEILRQATLKKFAAAVNELQSQVTQAQEELKLAETKSPADQQAAMKHLQEVQTEQSQKLQQIGGQLQTQIAALKQLKGATQ